MSKPYKPRVTKGRFRDTLGRVGRNKIVKPCGCFSAEVYRTATVEGIGSRSAWCEDFTQCEGHTGAAVIGSYKMQLLFSPNDPSNDTLRAFIAKHETRMLEAAKQADAVNESAKLLEEMASAE